MTLQASHGLRAAALVGALGVVPAEGVVGQEPPAYAEATVQVVVRITPSLDVSRLPAATPPAAFTAPASPPARSDGRIARLGDHVGVAAPPSAAPARPLPPLVRWVELHAEGDRRLLRQHVAIAY